MSLQSQLLTKSVIALKACIREATVIVQLIEQGAVSQLKTDNMSMETKILHIKSIVALQADIAIQDLEGNSRERKIKDARHVAMYLIKRKLPRLSNETIGTHFGNRDSGTVAHALARIKDIMKSDADVLFRESISNMEKLI